MAKSTLDEYRKKYGNASPAQSSKPTEAGTYTGGNEHYNVETTVKDVSYSPELFNTGNSKLDEYRNKYAKRQETSTKISFTDKGFEAAKEAREDRYKTWEDVWREKYEGQNHDQLQRTLDTLKEGSDEYKWLEEYSWSDDIMTVEDYKKLIYNTETKLNDFLENEDYDATDTNSRKAYSKVISDYEAELERLRAGQWRVENKEKYEPLSENADFKKESQVAEDGRTAVFGLNVFDKWIGFGDPVYDYINNLDNDQMAYQMSNDGSDMQGLYKYSFMTDTERSTYNYLYNTDGKKAAKEYLDYLGYELDARRLQQISADNAEYAKEHPGLASVQSVGTNLVSGIGYLDVAGQNAVKGIKEAVTGEYAGPINYNSWAMTPSATTTSIRSTVASEINAKAAANRGENSILGEDGTIALKEDEHPILSRLFNGKSWGDVYQLGMSMADSTATMLLSPVMGSAGTVLLGGSAATQGMLDAVANGATDGQALTIGFVNGAAEWAFEKIGVDNLVNKIIKGDKAGIVRALISQGLSEGGEELGTSVVNTFADHLIMAENSGYSKAIEAYMDQGLSKEEAAKRALQDIAISMGWDFIGGVASGGIMGAGGHVLGSGLQTAVENKTAKQLYSSQASEIANRTLELNPDNENIQKMQAKLDKGKTLSGRKIVELVNAHDTAAIASAAEARLQELGETGEVKVLSTVLAKQAAGEKLNRAERRAIEKSKYGTRVANELNPENIRAGQHTSEWAENIGTKRINALEYGGIAKLKEQARAVDEYNKNHTPIEPRKVEQAVPAEVKPTGNETVDAVINKAHGKELSGNDVRPILESTEAVKALETVVGPLDLKGKSSSEQRSVVREAITNYAAAHPVTAVASTSVGSKAVPGSVESVASKYGKQAGAVRSIYNISPVENVDSFATAFETAYTIGLEGGYESAAVDAESTQVMSEAQRRLAYATGKAVRAARQLEGIKRGNTGGGVVRARGVKAADINKRFKQGSNQKTALQVLRTIAEATGFTIEVFDSSGDYSMEQGSFDWGTDVVAIDIASGICKAEDVEQFAKYAMLRTFCHEFTHVGEKWAAEEYNILRTAVIEALSENEDFDLDYRIAEIQRLDYEAKKSQYMAEGMDETAAAEKAEAEKMSWDMASREVVAEAMTDVLPESNFIRSLYEKSPSLAKRLGEALRRFLARVKSYYDELVSNPSREAQALKVEIGGTVKYLEGIVEKWDAMALAAVENYQNAAVDNVSEAEVSIANVTGSADGAVERSTFTDKMVSGPTKQMQVRTEEEAYPKMIMSPTGGAPILVTADMLPGLASSPIKGLVNGKEVDGFTGRQIRNYVMKQEGFSVAQRKNLNEFMSEMSKFMKEAGITYKFIGLQDVDNAKLSYNYNPDGSIKSIILSAMVKNGDYPVNFDLTSICKKRVAMSSLIEKLCARGSVDSGIVDLTPANIFKINTALKDAGYETACLGCFVESKRYNVQEWAVKFCNKWNAAVKKVNPDATYFGYGKGETADVTVDRAVKLDAAASQYITNSKGKRLESAMKKYLEKEARGETLIEGKTVKVFGEEIHNTFNKATRDRLEKSYTLSEELKQKYLTCDVTTLTMEDVSLLLEHEILPGASVSNKMAVTNLVNSGEEYQHLLRPSDLLTAEGIAQLEKLPNFHGVLYGHYGSGTPKLVQGFTPYNSEIALLPAKKGKVDLAEYLYSIAGVRMQSFSDFQIQNIYDYLQMVGDLAARKLPAHAYTKEMPFAKLLGMTGIKTNLSVMFDIDYKVDRAHAGLTLYDPEVHKGEYAKIVLEDEQGQWVYNIGDYATQRAYEKAYPDESKRFLQSIGFADAVKLQTSEGYTANCGIIGVGFSDLGILAMLDDKRIRYVIPYHASSLPDVIKKATNIYLGTDYTSWQNTTKIASITDANGNKVKWSFKEATKRLGSAQAALNELNDHVENDGWKVDTKKAQNGHGSFTLYEDLQETNDPRKTVDNFFEWCANNNTLPVFYQFAGHENYYKLLYDFNVYDCVTEEYAPHHEVKNIYPTQDAAGNIVPGDATEEGFSSDYLRETINKQMSAMNSYFETLDKDLDTLAENVEQGRYEIKKQYSFRGVTSNKRSDIKKLATAQDMLESGIDPEKVRLATGWFKGYDGKWRNEIDDSGAKLRTELLPSDLRYLPEAAEEIYRAAEKKRKATLEQLQGLWRRDTEPSDEEVQAARDADLKTEKEVSAAYKLYLRAERNNLWLSDILDHPKLYKAYPSLKTLPVSLTYQTGGKLGSNSTIAGKGMSIAVDGGTPAQLLSTIMHEVQHEIQNIEGFAKGSNPGYWEANGAKETPEYKEAEAALERIKEKLNAIEYHGSPTGAPLKTAAMYAYYNELLVKDKRSKAKASIAFDEEQIAVFEARAAEQGYSDLLREYLFAKQDLDIAKIEAKGKVNGYDLYYRTAGEVEARDVQSRLELSEKERKNTRPDIDRDNVVFMEGQRPAKQYQARKTLDDEATKKYNKHSKYSETETLFLSWAHSSAPAGEVRRFSRFGKFRYYEKTESGCVELSRAQYEERRNYDAQNTYRRAEREVSKAADSDGRAKGDGTGHLDSNRNSGGNAPVSGQTLREEFRDDARRSISDGSGDNRRATISQVQKQQRATMTHDRIDYLIADSGAGKRTDYAQKWITSINPTDFLNMTLGKANQDRTKFDTMPGDYDSTVNDYDFIEGGLKKSRQTPYLAIDINTGEVVGHEGRHRMRALEKEGITSAEIVIELRDEDGRVIKELNGYGKALETIESLTIYNQRGTGQSAVIQNIIPLNKANRDNIIKSYGPANAGAIQYSRRGLNETQNKAVEIFGTTTDFNEVGFILPSGEMLKFTDNKHKGERQYDHRAIGMAYGVDVDLSVDHGFNEDSAKHLEDFIEDGGIRFDPGDPDLDMDAGMQLSSSVPLTKEQERAIRDFVEWKQQREEAIAVDEDSMSLYSGPLALHIEFGGKAGIAVGQSSKNLDAWGVKHLSYEGGQINASRIISDIQHYYETGEVRQPSETARFRYQRRTPSYTDREVLELAAEDMSRLKLTDGERSALDIFGRRLDNLKSLEQQRDDQRRILAELNNAAKPNEDEIRKTRSRIITLGKKIKSAEAQVLSVEDKQVLKKVLHTARRVVETEQRNVSRENRNTTAMRHKVRDIVNELNNYLLKGTKDKHVMIGLQKAVASALDVVNMDTIGAEERIAKLEAELMKAKTPEKIQEISRKIDRVRAQGDKMSEKLANLKAAYAEIKDSSDPLIANSHDEVIEAAIESVAKTVGETPLRNMTLEQLEEVYDLYKMVLTTIRNSNKSFKDKKKESIDTLASNTQAEVEAVGGKKKHLKVFEGVSSFLWNNFKPVYAFKAIGSKTLSRLFDNVRAGEDTWAKDVSEAKAFYLEQSKKYGYDSWNLEETHAFTSTTGMDFKLTLEQMMSLYAYSKRQQAEDHLKYGGIVFEDSFETKKLFKKFDINLKTEDATAYNISPETMAAIAGTLTADQKAFVDAMQDYLSTTMGEKGNEVSLELYGVKLFKEKHYFPLKSAPQYMAKAREQAKGEVKIKNSGFTKETTPNAKNPIVLESFLDVWANHVNDMSMYHAFTLSLEDFYRVYNYRTPSANENMPTEGVNPAIQNAYGRAATNYIEQLLKDLNGGARSDPTAGFINKMMGLFKKGAVFASASVVVQQPSAVARAMALVDSKYFVGRKVDSHKHKALWEEVKQYAPVAMIKEMGYFDTNMGMSTVDFIKAKEYESWDEKMKALVVDGDYRDEILSKAPALADELAWCMIWEAVKRETAAQHSALKTTSDEFLQLAGARFTEVIVNTQVYDSVLSRSANMRSKDTGMKMATAFLAEPTTSINMIADALIQGKRGDKKQAGKAIGAVIASQILNAILVSFVYAARDDDEDETYWEKYFASVLAEVKDSFNLAGYIPFLKDIVSIVQGYDVERSDIAVIADIWKAFEQLDSDKISGWRKIENFVGGIAQLFGLPVRNIMRDARALWQTVDSSINGENITAAGLRYAIKGTITNETVSDRQQLYEAMLDGDTAHSTRVAGRFEDQAAVDSAIRKALRENDPRIHDAAVARHDGDIAEYTRIAKEIIAEGHFKQDHVVMAIISEMNSLDTEETESESKAVPFYTDDDYYKAIVAGDRKAAAEVKTGLIKQDVAKGELESKAEQSVENSFVTNVKNAFLDGEMSEITAKSYLTAFGGKDEDEATTKLAEWKFERKYGYSWSNYDNAYRLGDVSKEQLVDAMVEIKGLDRFNAVYEVEYLDFQINHPEYELSKSKYLSYHSKIDDVGVSLAEAGIDIAMWLDYEAATEGLKKVQKLLIIDALPLTPDQKDAIYFKEGWKRSTLGSAAWR